MISQQFSSRHAHEATAAATKAGGMVGNRPDHVNTSPLSRNMLAPAGAQ
ncbi:MAG: hypothetical protein KF688_02090 [Pirellulales bacterium]|nr:hypothetical protein [Pirellulales bacterium]